VPATEAAGAAEDATKDRRVQTDGAFEMDVRALFVDDIILYRVMQYVALETETTDWNRPVPD
jgi:hypothetical protein